MSRHNRQAGARSLGVRLLEILLIQSRRSPGVTAQFGRTASVVKQGDILRNILPQPATRLRNRLCRFPFGNSGLQKIQDGRLRLCFQARGHCRPLLRKGLSECVRQRSHGNDSKRNLNAKSNALHTIQIEDHAEFHSLPYSPSSASRPANFFLASVTCLLVG